MPGSDGTTDLQTEPITTTAYPIPAQRGNSMQSEIVINQNPNIEIAQEIHKVRSPITTKITPCESDLMRLFIDLEGGGADPKRPVPPTEAEIEEFTNLFEKEIRSFIKFYPETSEEEARTGLIANLNEHFEAYQETLFDAIKRHGFRHHFIFMVGDVCHRLKVFIEHVSKDKALDSV